MRAKGVEAVLFDAGNTLIYLDPDRVAEMLAAMGIPVDAQAVRNAEIQARRRLHDAVVPGRVGTEPEVWREYFVTLFLAAGVPGSRVQEVGERLRETHAAAHLWTHVEAGTGEVLGSLSQAGYRLGVVSNADGRVEEVLRRVGLHDAFEFVIDSAVVGVEKPDRRIFDAACHRLDLAASSCLYVGDLYPVDYVGATAAGMSGVILDPLNLHGTRAPTIPTLAALPDFLAALTGR